MYRGCLLLVLLPGVSLAGVLPPSLLPPQEELTEAPLTEEDVTPTTSTPDDLTTSPAPAALDPEMDHLANAREMATLNIMDRILRALGPPFGESLPQVLTNDSLATVPTPVHFTADPCPYRYKRCSSQTFFPSCEIPPRTDASIWPQRFNLYFSLTEELDQQLDVINATLRLYKNNSLPLTRPKGLLIKAYGYTRSLTRRRPKKTLVADTQVQSDYIGWVSLSVERIVRKWRRARHNHGMLVTVTDVDDIPWDAPRIFVTMDCAAGNNHSYLPLPFEVQTAEEGQQYPALNVRLGSLDDESEVEGPSSPPPATLTPDLQADDPVAYEDYDGASPPLHHSVPSHAASLARRRHLGAANFHNEGMDTYVPGAQAENDYNQQSSRQSENDRLPLYVQDQDYYPDLRVQDDYPPVSRQVDVPPMSGQDDYLPVSGQNGGGPRTVVPSRTTVPYAMSWHQSLLPQSADFQDSYDDSAVTEDMGEGGRHHTPLAYPTESSDGSIPQHGRAQQQQLWRHSVDESRVQRPRGQGKERRHRKRQRGHHRRG